MARFKRVGKLGRRLPPTFLVGQTRWKIIWEKPPKEMNAHGLTDWDIKTIQIDPDLDDELLMSTLIDEAGHAALGPSIDNDAMGVMSDTASRLLDRCGFRLQEDVD